VSPKVDPADPIPYWTGPSASLEMKSTDCLARWRIVASIDLRTNKSAPIRNSRATRRIGGPGGSAVCGKLLKELVAASGLEPLTYGL